MTASGHGDVVIAGLATEAERAEHERARRVGVSHARALEPRAPQPWQPVTVELTAGPAAPAGDAWLELESGARIPLAPAGSEWDTLAWGYVRRYRGTLPGQPAGVVRYRLGVGDALADGGAPHALVVGASGAPAWAADAVTYQVWVDRFWAGDAPWPGSGAAPADRYGGTLAGLLERLDHLVALGANTVWLNPIHPSSAYHGYEITDYLSVDPGLGTLADFDRLVSALHAQGLRLVLDFVPSHVSHLHPSFAAARADARSPFARWFRFDDWPDGYRSFFGVPTMPQLDHDEPAVREHLVESTRPRTASTSHSSTTVRRPRRSSCRPRRHRPSGRRCSAMQGRRRATRPVG